jgi:hypothetical protein
MAHLTQGIYADIPEADYHADLISATPSLSSGTARLILNKSPRHAWLASQRLNPHFEPTESSVFDIGRAIHREILGRGGDYVAVPEDLLSADGGIRSKAAKEWVQDAKDQGLTVLKPDEIALIKSTSREAVAEFASMGITFDPARSEMTALAEIEGAWCRARIDNAPIDPRQPLNDIKTCEDASIEAVIKAVEKYNLDVQIAHYSDTWFAATGERRGGQLLFIEKKKRITDPTSVCVVRLCDIEGDEADYMVDAFEKVAHARQVWRDCVRTGNFYGYPKQIAIIGARKFYRQHWAAKKEQ